MPIPQPAPAAALRPAPSGTASIFIAAPSQVVYDLLTNPDHMNELSPECVDARWSDGWTSALVGARFHGWNRAGERSWDVECVVTAAEPDREFSFRAGFDVLGELATDWRYVLRSVDGGVLVTETFAAPVLGHPDSRATHGPGRFEMLIAGMKSTLENLKRAAERATQASNPMKPNTKGSTMSTAPLKQAIRSARAVLDEVKPEHMGLQTPCASWKVSDLVNHMIGAQYFFSGGMKGEAPSGDAPDFAAGDFLSAFDQATAETVAVFEADGAMERIAKLPFGDMPGSAFIGLAMTDTFTHAWDLAKALGRSTDLAPELAAQLLEGSKASIQEGFRGPDGVAPFGAEQPAPAGASNADKLAAFLGRTV